MVIKARVGPSAHWTPAGGRTSVRLSVVSLGVMRRPAVIRPLASGVWSEDDVGISWELAPALDVEQLFHAEYDYRVELCPDQHQIIFAYFVGSNSLMSRQAQHSCRSIDEPRPTKRRGSSFPDRWATASGPLVYRERHRAAA